MGADEKSVLKKCGEILINIKAKNKKNKTYTFNCVFCETNCDQLKKFSIHLVDKHLQEFSEGESEDKTIKYVPKIKKELKNTKRKDDLQSTECLPHYEDPLETIGPVKEMESAEMIMDMEIKEEEVIEPNFDMDYEDNDFNKDDMVYQDCLEDNDDNSDCESSGSEYKVKTKSKQLSKLRKRKKVKVSEKKKEIKFKSEIEQAKKRLKTSEENTPPLDEKELCVALLKAFEKQTILWKVKERAVQTSVTKKFFEIVANEVNEQLKSNITFEDAKIRIRKMRNHYTAEMQKKEMEEVYELPWYAEHMEFLHENIKALLKGRKYKLLQKGIKSLSKQAKKRLKLTKENAPEIDEKELSIALLKAFEKQTILWRVKERVLYNKHMQKYFEIVANEVNEKLKSSLTWEAAKTRIRKMRNHYSQEILKKNKGEDYELPWYSEHMEFLKENVQVLLKGRQHVNKYRSLKTMDESELSTLIDIYKKHESLWQVNNIGFGAIRNREQEFGKIAEELKSNQNINVTVDTLHPRVNYMLRIYSENKKHQLECELGKRKFEPSTPLYEKMSFLSAGYGPFKCSQCNEIIKRFDDYREHVAKHNDTIAFSCPLCKSTFYKYKHYVSHARRHLELNYHFCKYCDRGFSSTSELRLHERSHTGENPYLCQICGATFRAANSYDNHVRRHEKRFRYICHICNQGFTHMQALNDHVKAHLNIRDIVCNICGKTFTSKIRLKNHQYIHSEEKRYKCQDCGKEFAQDAGLRQHRKQHQPFPAQRKKESSLNFYNEPADFLK